MILKTQQNIIELVTRPDGRKVYLDVYGCQMNVSDTEVVWAILEEQGYARTLNPREADVWLLVTCSIRDGAEQVRLIMSIFLEGTEVH